MPDSGQNWQPDILTQLVEQLRAVREEIRINALRLERMDDDLRLAIKDIRISAERKYVTQEEFKPIKLIAFGIVGIFMAAVLTAIATLVVAKR